MSAYVDLEKFQGGTPAAIGPLREVLSNGLVEKTVHDMKRAVGLLDHFNITLEGVRHDTYLAASASGLGVLDATAVIQLLETINGVEVKGDAA